MSVTGMQVIIDEIPGELKFAFQVAGVDPVRDTVVEAARKFRKLGLRHLALYLSTGGFLCLCSDAEMSKRLHEAINRMDAELDAEEDRNEKEIC